VADTPSGGLHFLFAYPADGREIRNSAGNRLEGPGLDVRGDGGQINAAPTTRAEARIAGTMAGAVELDIDAVPERRRGSSGCR